MTNMDNHPRVLSLSNSSTPAGATPASQSRRVSNDSTHNEREFAAMQDKTHKTLSQSIKKMWKDVKNHAIEHHRSVNAAYASAYGYGTRTPTGSMTPYGGASTPARTASIVPPPNGH